jgi:exosortase/archaeosortase
MVTVPVIYLLNIIRNVGVIYGVEVLNISFYVMHNIIGKIGSLIALIVLAYLAFEILPELYDTIVSLFQLPKRKGPLERILGVK